MREIGAKPDANQAELAPAIMQSLRSLHDEIHEIHEALAGHRKAFLTVEELADLAGRAPFTVRNWIRDGRLQAIRVQGSGPRGRLLIPRAEVDRLIASGKGDSIPAIAGE